MTSKEFRSSQKAPRDAGDVSAVPTLKQWHLLRRVKIRRRGCQYRQWRTCSVESSVEFLKAHGLLARLTILDDPTLLSSNMYGEEDIGRQHLW